MSFTPTHRVPAGGLLAWATPDSSQASVATLGAATELEVLESFDEWVQVGAANGWIGWVQADRLVPVDEPVPVSVPAAGTTSGLGERRRAIDYEAILSSPWRRLGAYLLDGVLFLVTLVIGYLIWLLVFTWRRGQTPGKALLGMRVLRVRTGTGATWGWMFLRDFLVEIVLIGILSNITFGIGFIVAALMVFSATRQTLWDRIVGTIVINDVEGNYLPI